MADQGLTEMGDKDGPIAPTNVRVTAFSCGGRPVFGALNVGANHLACIAAICPGARRQNGLHGA